MNSTVVVGRAGQDAEIKYFESGKIRTTFSLAVNRWDSKTKSEVTDWFNIDVWDKQAEFAGEDIKKGRVEYRTDSYGNVATIIGKVSFDEAKLVENMDAFVSLILKAKPSSVKGTYVKNIAVSSTMGPSVKIDTNSFDK